MALKAGGAARRGGWRDQTRERRQEAQRRAASNKAGGGGGGSDIEVWPVQHNGAGFWPPNGLPMPNAQKEGETVLHGSESWLRKGESDLVILAGAHKFCYGHAPQRFQDISALPKLLQFRANKNRDALKSAHYACTFDANATAGGFASYEEAESAGWQPAEGWQDREGGGYLLPGGYFSVEVEETADGVLVHMPPAHRHVSEADYGPFGSLEEAMWRAESAVLQAKSCAFCAQSQLEYVERWGRDDKLVWDGRETLMIVGFDLRWLFGEQGKGDKAGYYRMDPDAYTEPEGSDRAVRSGWGWLRTYPRKSNKSSSYRTYEEYAKYVAELAGTCTNCLGDHGERKGRRDHDIAVTHFVCEHCGGDLVDERHLRSAPQFRAPDRDEDGVEDWTTAGLFQLLNEFECDCPHCGKHTIGHAELECSSCDNPTPMMPWETMTRRERDSEGGFYFFTQVQDPDTGRIYYPDWSHMQAVANGPLRDRDGKEVLSSNLQDVLAPALEHAANGTFIEQYLDPTNSANYPQLTPRQQAKLIGSPVFGEPNDGYEDR